MGCTPAQTYIYGLGSAKPRRTPLTYTTTAPHTHTPTDHQYQHMGIHIGHAPVHRYEPYCIDFKQDGLNTKSQSVTDTPKEHRW